MDFTCSQPTQMQSSNTITSGGEESIGKAFGDSTLVPFSDGVEDLGH